MNYLNQKTARETLQMFRASAAAWADGKDRQEWVDQQKKLAGYS